MKKIFSIDPETEEAFAHLVSYIYTRAQRYEAHDAEYRAIKVDELTGEDDELQLSWEVLCCEIDEVGFSLLNRLRCCDVAMLSKVWAIAKLGEAEVCRAVAIGDADVAECTPLIAWIEKLPNLLTELQSHMQTWLFIRQILSIKNLSCALSKGVSIACDTGFFSDAAREALDSWEMI